MIYIPKSAFNQRKTNSDPWICGVQPLEFSAEFTMDLEASLVGTTDGEKPEAATTSHAW